jgi:hypothetical protein
MHRLPRPIALSLAALVVLSVGLSGCAPTAGTVTVEVRSDPRVESDWPVKVTIWDASKEVVARQSMRAGESMAFPGIPFGWVRISAEGLCVVETKLTETGVRAIFEPHNCTI